MELACGAMLMSVLLMVAVNLSIMYLGYQLNDHACRDACRAAAQQRSAAEALDAASRSLMIQQSDGHFVSRPELSTGAGDFVYNDYSGDPFAGNPYVTVTTTVAVKTPVPVFFLGRCLGGEQAMVMDHWTFRRRYTFPIVDFNLVLP